ncbi:MAG: amidohydrolase [Candidatus Hodarchaeales archaeon]|jgi:predicted amidohydrolase YtcJ
MYADLIIFNGNIITMDENNTHEEAVATKFGKILLVGNNQEVIKTKDESTRMLDLKGRTVIPGLIDSHGHMIASGIAKLLYVDLSEEAGVASIHDLQMKLVERVKKTSEGEWIFGYQEDDAKLLEKRHPTRWELDEVSTIHPILITTVGGHFWITNSKALELANVTKETLDPVGGKFDRDPNTGELTGGLHEKALNLIREDEAPPFTREIAQKGASQILKECASVGLTCVYDTVDGTHIRAALDLKNQGKLPIRVRMDANIDFFTDLDKIGIYRGFGDDWLRLCGLKYFFDGAISARTAAVSEPYLNKPDFYGVMATTRKIATEVLSVVYEKGYRISAHANGDRAINLFLDIMEELQAKYPRNDPRNRDIHCTVVNPEIINRIKKLGILPTIFGPYPYYHGDKLIPSFGEQRLEWMFAARSFIDAEVMISAHSDHPCAPNPPLMALHSLVNRKTKTGRSIGETQKISIHEALRLYTINAAYHSFDEDTLGSIEEGKLADFVILGKDILTVDSSKIKDIPIEMTIVEGKIVYKRKINRNE